ncbi:hypothetical protein ATANTOWER_016815 [Ataeniobius toweri]|uniref:Uncharacterized protein n=1 Tax=Ataeniobius toweri TaxID=208326 RepID=A0ABU7AQ50_9TELE|nr:hypothetical protein [Ataeniobius toweri]
MRILCFEVNVGVNAESKPTNVFSLSVKPRDKSLPSDLGRRLTGRTLHLDETVWPLIQRNVSSTTEKIRKQQTVLTTNDRSKSTENTGIPLQNRLTPLLQNFDHLKGKLIFHQQGL